MEPTVRAIDLTYCIGSRTLWTDLNFEVSAGSFTALTGPSGSGKTTLLNCIGLLDRPTAGELTVCGHSTSGISERRARALRRTAIGYLFQDFALVEADSIRDNVALAAPVGLGRRERLDRVSAALDAVGLAGRQKEKVFVLSGGEQQRVALARILVRQPELILADEPTASLDRSNAAMVLDLLREQAEAGAAVIIVSHDPWVVSQCDREVSLATETARETAVFIS